MMDDWMKFWQGRNVRIILYALCTVICGYYGIGAIMDIVSPGEAMKSLIDTIGMGGFYAVTGLRFLACAWACVSFARMAYKTYKEQDA